MIVVAGHLRPYDWGRTDGLTRWTASTAGPQAELWFGRAGDDLVEAHPLLTKLLAAATPLSLQVHPTGDLVDRMWGSASSRSLLADHVEKNELLLALEPFTAFAGFRDAADTARLLHGVGLDAPAARAAAGDHVGLVRALFGLPAAAVADALRRLPDVIHDVLAVQERAAVELVRSSYPHDRGVLVALCLAVHELEAGDALYVPAGVVHSYVAGLGVEVMTASDNVLRLGLTRKHVAVDEALAALVDRAPTLVRGPVGPGTFDYRVREAPFAVSRLQGAGAEALVPAGAAATALCVEGSAVVESAGRSERLAPGRAALVAATDGGAVVRTDGLAVVVSSS